MDSENSIFQEPVYSKQRFEALKYCHNQPNYMYQAVERRSKSALHAACTFYFNVFL